MKRSVGITWDQLRVGAAIVLALAILVVAGYKLGQAANLFGKRYTLVIFLADAKGLREGGSVRLAGQLVGTVKKIDFLPVDADTTRNLRLELSVDQSIQEQIRGDSRAKLGSLGLLGDKVVDINVGTPRYAVLTNGDTVPTVPTLDYDAVIAQAAGAVDDVVGLTHDLRSITGGIVRGDGTMGQLLTNRSLYDELNGTLARANGLLLRLQNPNGTVGRLLDDPTMYNNTVRTIASLDSLLRTVNSSQGTMGKLLRDTTLYANMVSITQNADSLTKLMAQGDGLANKLLTDQVLYDQLVKLTTDMNAILADVRRDPGRYTKGLIGIQLFGGGKKK